MTEATIGVDVGGSKIAAGLVAPATGEILSRRSTQTRADRDGRAVLRDAVRLAEELARDAEQRGLALVGVGVGVPELVGLDGAILTASVVGWRDLPVAEAFSVLAPSIIESDVRAAGLAEAVLGAGRTYDPFAYVTVGTGISYCLVAGGRPYTGARGAAILLGSGTRTVPCAACGREASIVLEEAAAGPCLVRDYRTLGGEAAGADEVLAAAAAGDTRATQVVERASHLVGAAIGLVVDLLDPAAIVVGGGLGSAAGTFFDGLVAAAREHVWYEGARNLPIVRAAFVEDSGIVGAALAAGRGRDQLCPAG